MGAVGITEMVRQLMKAGTEAVELLNEVRTGDDFEVNCWDCAEQLRQAIGNLQDKLQSTREQFEAENRGDPQGVPGT